MPELHSYASSDAGVQRTNDDAQSCKASCVKLGYFADDFLQFFVGRGCERRAPLINRGYYTRIAAIKQLISHFLSIDHAGKQILSLGAGFDTTFFHVQASAQGIAKYVEIDFAEVTRKKARIIAQNKELHSLIPGFSPDAISRDTGRIRTKAYDLLPGDLRDTQKTVEEIRKTSLSTEAPTLIIAECVLVYMPAESSQDLVSQLGSIFSTSAFIIYEQIRPYDAFGQQMLTNIEKRNCALLGIHATPDLKGQKKRFTDHGWDNAWAKDMDDIYAQEISLQERRRIERLELFDELEEWHLIQKHYCITVGFNDKSQLLPSGLTKSGNFESLSK